MLACIAVLLLTCCKAAPLSCWSEGFTEELCCDLKHGSQGSNECWSGPFSYQTCCPQLSPCEQALHKELLRYTLASARISELVFHRIYHTWLDVPTGDSNVCSAVQGSLFSALLFLELPLTRLAPMYTLTLCLPQECASETGFLQAFHVLYGHTKLIKEHSKYISLSLFERVAEPAAAVAEPWLVIAAVVLLVSTAVDCASGTSSRFAKAFSVRQSLGRLLAPAPPQTLRCVDTTRVALVACIVASHTAMHTEWQGNALRLWYDWCTYPLPSWYCWAKRGGRWLNPCMVVLSSFLVGQFAGSHRRGLADCLCKCSSRLLRAYVRQVPQFLLARIVCAYGILTLPSNMGFEKKADLVFRCGRCQKHLLEESFLLDLLRPFSHALGWHGVELDSHTGDFDVLLDIFRCQWILQLAVLLPLSLLASVARRFSVVALALSLGIAVGFQQIDWDNSYRGARELCPSALMGFASGLSFAAEAPRQLPRIVIAAAAISGMVLCLVPIQHHMHTGLTGETGFSVLDNALSEHTRTFRLMGLVLFSAGFSLVLFVFAVIERSRALSPSGGAFTAPLARVSLGIMLNNWNVLAAMNAVCLLHAPLPGSTYMFAGYTLLVWEASATFAVLQWCCCEAPACAIFEWLVARNSSAATWLRGALRGAWR